MPNREWVAGGAETVDVYVDYLKVLVPNHHHRSWLLSKTNLRISNFLDVSAVLFFIIDHRHLESGFQQTESNELYSADSDKSALAVEWISSIEYSDV